VKGLFEDVKRFRIEDDVFDDYLESLHYIRLMRIVRSRHRERVSLVVVVWSIVRSNGLTLVSESVEPPETKVAPKS
jgi:hypothetical protein